MKGWCAGETDEGISQLARYVTGEQRGMGREEEEGREGGGGGGGGGKEKGWGKGGERVVCSVYGRSVC